MTDVNVTVNGITFTVSLSSSSHITYDNTWQLLPQSRLNSESTSTSAYAGLPGSKATFEFTGIAVLAAATFPEPLPPNANQTLPNVTVTLDAQTPTRVSVASTAGDPFFSAAPLSPGAHTLAISVDDASPAFPFILDAFLSIPPQDVAAAYVAQPSSSASSSPTPAGASSGIDPDQLQFETLLRQVLAAKPQASGPPVAAIVGGTVGIVVLLSLAATAVWYFFVRPRRKGGRAFFYAPAKAGDMLKDEFDLEPEPYPLLASTNGRSRSPSPERVPTRRSSAHTPSLS